MGKILKSRTKSIMLTILICFITVNVFPYDIIGIEKKNENISEVLLTVNYGEKIDDYVDTEYRVLKSDADSAIYLISIESTREKTTINDICKLLNIPQNNHIAVNYEKIKGKYNWNGSKIKKIADFKWVTALLAITGVCIVFKTIRTSGDKDVIKNKIWFTLFSISYLLLSEVSNIFIKNKLSEFNESSKDMFDRFQYGMEKSRKEYKNEYLKSTILKVFEGIFLSIYAYYYTHMIGTGWNSSKSTTTFDLAILLTNAIINSLTDESLARYLLLRRIEDKEYKDIITVKGMIYESP
ncbi:MAG: hypothetical protein AB7V16_12280 [Vulcanibacillus sp.]